jgi:hypothetical protein
MGRGDCGPVLTSFAPWLGVATHTMYQRLATDRHILATELRSCRLTVRQSVGSGSRPDSKRVRRRRSVVAAYPPGSSPRNNGGGGRNCSRICRAEVLCLLARVNKADQ